jgi:hypothetical protein
MASERVNLGPPLLDLTWNEAIEAAARDCEREAYSLRAMGAEEDSWTWPTADRMDRQAASIRRLKRC